MFAGKNSPWVLFDDSSTQVESPFIYIPEGYVGEFLSFNFAYKTTDNPNCTQMAIIHAILAGPPPEGSAQFNPCGEVFWQDGRMPIILEEAPIVSPPPDCEEWGLDACSTIRLLDIPGTYRLVLNDPTAVGVVHVYLKFWSQANMQRPSQLYFGR